MKGEHEPKPGSGVVYNQKLGGKITACFYNNFPIKSISNEINKTPVPVIRFKKFSFPCKADTMLKIVSCYLFFNTKSHLK